MQKDLASHDSVRTSYNAVAGAYADHIRDELRHKPLDRALLNAVIEDAGAGAAVVDAGCGPGHVTGWLAAHGARAVGIDLSPGMVDVARREHPDVEFRVGDLLALPAGDAEFAAAVTLYAIIHLTAAEFDRAFAELRRVLRADGLLLVAFHAGAEVRHRDEWWEVPVNLDFRFHSVETVGEALERTGFAVEAVLTRRSYPHEAESRRGYVLARAQPT